MAAGCSILDGLQDENEDAIFITSTYYELPKGVYK